MIGVFVSIIGNLIIVVLVAVLLAWAAMKLLNPTMSTERIIDHWVKTYKRNKQSGSSLLPWAMACSVAIVCFAVIFGK